MASTFTVLIFDHAGDGLRVNVGDGDVLLAVGHDLFAPVADRPERIAPNFFRQVGRTPCRRMALQVQQLCR